ncbi:MAG: TolC family protein, partial [Bacteroidaceae bacterium]|nr:TolC family protein [Bacteroidaceae bacterium]
LNQEYVSLSLSLPILDWGRGRGQVRVARSNLALTETQAEQGMRDFRQNVQKIVMQFNMQGRKVNIAAKTDRQAEHRYEVARRLYVLGRSTILDLNSAISEKDNARRNYINAQSTYWTLYYTIRSMTGYDFLNGREIAADIKQP